MYGITYIYTCVTIYNSVQTARNEIISSVRAS